MRLRMHSNVEEVNGGNGFQQKFTVNPFTHEVEVPDELGHSLLATSSGAVRVIDDFDDKTDLKCAACGHVHYDVLLRKE